MIGPDQAANGVWMAAVLILLGLAPGLYQTLIEGLWSAARQLTFRIHMPMSPSSVPGLVPQPRWLAAAGMAILAVTAALYVI